MKFPLIVFVTMTLCGCSAQPMPMAPSPPVPAAPPASSFVSLWGMVINAGGACIVGATVEVVRGQGLGQSITQTTPCDAWGDDGGVVFKDLTPGVEMTLRASASGYVAQEKTVVPNGAQRALLFEPSRLQ